MKWRAYTLAIVASSVFVACGNNSSDKEVVTTVDTATTIPGTAITTVVDTAKTVAVNIPAKTKADFEKKYPRASNVKWEYQQPAKEGIDWELTGWPEMDEQDHKAWFHWQGSDHQIRYDKKGNWVGTTNVITDHTSLPSAVTNAVKNGYDGYTVRSVTKENDKERTAYEIVLEKDNSKIKTRIDEKGKVLKKKTM